MSDQRNPAKTTGRRPRLPGLAMSIAGALALAIGGMTWSTATFAGHKGKDAKAGSSVEKKIDLMLDKVEATGDQRSRVQAIVRDAVTELKQDGQSQEKAWRDFAAALSKGSIDRDALEKLRRSKVESADRKSQRMLTALAAAAEVLTPDQRAKLAAELETGKWKDKSTGSSKGKWKNK